MRQCKTVGPALLFLLTCFCITTYADTAILANSKQSIDLTVIAVADEYIEAVILKKDIRSLNMQFSDTLGYPDVMFLKVPEVVIECKVKDISEDCIQVFIPASLISSLKTPSFSDDKRVDAALDETEKEPETTIDDERDEDKRQEQLTLKQESEINISRIHEEFRKGAIVDQIRTVPPENANTEKQYRLKIIRIKEARNSLEKVVELNEEDVQKENTAFPNDIRLGSIEGKILQNGTPLVDCQVKLQLLEKVGLISKGYRPVEGAVAFEAATDQNGIYCFMDMPTGLYKIYWRPSSESEWISRFKMEPDVTVKPGRLTNSKTIETLKRTLN
ncbi:MAG: hypothetical protein E3K32_04895 [wastewater metagenome]|nr:hypothetical protein [Candidatus Loosdrechtia aerotolerans]